MKQIIIAYLVLIVVVVALAVARNSGFDLVGLGLPGNSSTAEIDGKKINLMLAKTPKERMGGLSGKKNLNQNSGMLFVFDKKDIYPFWMKGMRFSIDIIFIDGDRNQGKIINIVEYAKVPSKNQHVATLPTYKPKAPVNYILEINAGLVKKHKIKVGDKVEFNNIE